MAEQLVDKTRQERVVRVFISSTFRDMHAEREELVKHIFPQLRKMCESRGITFTDVDLRWGVSEEQKAEGKVLPICLAEIQKCRPYFIGLLGERYGWVPDEIPPELIEREGWLKQHREKSVTELEILHGVLNNPEMANHACFYFRDPAYIDTLPASNRHDFVCATGQDKAKLVNLKERIKRSGMAVRENYANPKALGQMVLEDLTVAINQEFPIGQEPDPLEKEAAEHEAYARSRVSVYIGRKEYFDRLDRHAAGQGVQPLVILGESGSGKSALLANWVIRYRKAHPDAFIIQHYIGASPYSADWMAMLRRIMGEFKRYLHIEEEIPSKPEELRDAFKVWLYRAAAQKKIILVLDALNQLTDTDNAPDLPWLPHETPANMRLIVSMLPGRSLEEIRRRDWPVFTLAPLDAQERRKLIADYLQLQSKSLESRRVEQIVQVPQSANPLYLRVLLDELRIFGVYEQLDQRIDHYLQAKNPYELYGKVLARWEEDYGRDSSLVQDTLSLLWAARRGLSETELLDALGRDGRPLPRARWSPLYLAMSDALISRSGLLTFAHDFLRTAVHNAFLPTQSHQQKIHLHLAECFDRHFIQGGREVNEICWQFVQAGQWKQLYSKLADLGLLYVLYSTNPTDVMAYWAQIEANSCYKVMTAYQTLLFSPEHYKPIVVQIVASLLTLSHPVESLRLFEHLVTYYRQTGTLNELQTCLWSLAMLLHRQGRLEDALSLLREHDQLCINTNLRRELAASLAIQGQILRDRGEFDAAIRVLNEQESICREINDEYLLALGLGTQGTIFQTRGDLDAAMLCHKEQEAICRKFGFFELNVALGNQATIHHRRGELDTAMILYQQEEELCQKIGDKTGLASSLDGQAMIFRARGENEKALSLHKEEERLFREIGHKRGLAASLGNQAIVSLELGNLELASLLLVEQERICREIGDKVGLVASLSNQACVASKCNDRTKQITFLYEKGDVLAGIGDTKGMVETMAEIAGILLLSKDFQKALAMYMQVEQFSRQFGNPNTLEHSLRSQGLIRLSLGNFEEAMKLQQEAEVICRQTDNFEGLGLSLANQALILAQKRQVNGAFDLVKKAREIGLQHNLYGLIKQTNLLLEILCQKNLDN
ncbi:MAG: tetratricopeptide repeat protein [Sedimentisphaerales bacterium]|nr:tetratricopeptide repeat protein [Sedimentisphaerales bacterium]